MAEHIEGLIRSGELAVGARLPAERDLATKYGVAYDTIRRATALLRERGLIQTVHGRGTFVTATLGDDRRKGSAAGRAPRGRSTGCPPARNGWTTA